MKKAFALAAGILLILVPFTASGMQPLSESEMSSIRAKFGASQVIDGEKTSDQMESEAPQLHAPELSGNENESESKGNVRRYGSGIAIIIDNVQIYTSSGQSEIWYENTVESR